MKITTYEELRSEVKGFAKSSIPLVVIHSRGGLGKCIYLKDDDYIGNMIVKSEVKSLQIGTVLDCYDLDEKIFKEVKIKKKYKRIAKELLHIKLLSGREIHCTPEHLLLTVDGWYQAKDLVKGIHLTVQRTHKPKYTNSVGIHKVKLIGHMIAEGNLTGKYNCGFSNRDKDMVDDFRQSLRRLDKTVELKISPSQKENGSYRIVRKKKYRRGYGRGNSFNRWMEELGMRGKYSYEKEIPKIIFNLVDEEISAFISALYEGDGCIEREGFVYYSTSLKLVKQIQHLLTRFGIIARIRIHSDFSHERYKGKGYRTSYKLAIYDQDNKNRFINAIKFFTKKNKHKLKSMKKKAHNSNYTIFPTKDFLVLRGYSNFEHINKQTNHMNINLTSLPDYEVWWDRIESITEKQGKFEVIDLEIDNPNHNFLVNGIVVHNSHTVRDTLPKNILRFQAHATPASIIKRLYENRDSIILIDDVDGIIQNTQVKSLLKQLCELKVEKDIFWDSTSPIFEDMVFPFHGTWRVIVCLNNFKRMDDDLKAVMTRGIYLSFTPTNEEIYNDLSKWFTDEEILQYLYELRNMSKNFNFRIPEKCLMRKQAGQKWKRYMFSELRLDDKLRHIHDIKLNNFKGEYAITEWKKRTGEEKSSYYNYKQKYEELNE